MEWIGWGIGAWLLLHALMLAMMAKHFYTLEFRRGRYWEITEADVPRHVAALLEPEVLALRELGFEPLGWTEYLSHVGTTQRGFAAVLLHRDGRVVASVSPHQLPEPANPTFTSFLTVYDDGSSLLTVNGMAWAIIGDIPQTRVEDPYAGTLQQHFEAHLAADRASSREAVRPTLAAFVEASTRQLDGNVAGLAEGGALVPAGEGQFRPTLRAALGWAWGVRRKVGRYHQFIRARATRANQPPRPPLPVDVEVDAWLSQREQRERALPRTARLWLLGATLLASAVSFTPLVSGRDLAAIIGALLFHELGHWTAMRACGYRDTGIFFIPLFGAVTTGRNDSATPAQRLLVLLAGPVPGLVLGAALLATTSDEDVFRIASMFVGINAFNLLPLVPLDGGQVVNLLFVGRHPWLSAGFHLLATAAFVGGAVLLQVPLVALPAVFLALGFRSTLLAARLAHGVREAGDGSDRAIAAAAFDWLRQHGGAQLSFAQRLNAVEAYRTSRTVRARSGLQLTGTALAYAAALAIGPATWFALATTRGFDPNEAAACVPAEEAVLVEDHEGEAAESGAR